MSAVSGWWTEPGGNGFVTPAPTEGDQVTQITRTHGDHRCVRLTDIARAELSLDWVGIETTNLPDAARVSQLIARLIDAKRNPDPEAVAL